LPEVGRQLAAGEAFGVVESVKAASDVYAPVAGRVADVNGALADAPETINEAPYGLGWLIKLEPDDPGDIAALMDAQAYAAMVEAEA
jgi:glycine cleavage system H protein